MRNYGLFGLLWIALSVPACANTSDASVETDDVPNVVDANEPQEGANEDFSWPLPAGWESYTHSEWLESLDITDCEAENQGSESRRKRWVTLEGHTNLLSLTCGFGAYQDAFYLFVVDLEAETLKRVTLRPPEGSAGAKPDPLARGILYMSEQREAVEFVHLSAATGACGWRALYSTKDIKRGGLAAPEVAFGDDDCYNGISVEGWPKIH